MDLLPWEEGAPVPQSDPKLGGERGRGLLLPRWHSPPETPIIMGNVGRGRGPGTREGGEGHSGWGRGPARGQDASRAAAVTPGPAATVLCPRTGCCHPPWQVPPEASELGRKAPRLAGSSPGCGHLPQDHTVSLKTRMVPLQSLGGAHHPPRPFPPRFPRAKRTGDGITATKRINMPAEKWMINSSPALHPNNE